MKLAFRLAAAACVGFGLWALVKLVDAVRVSDWAKAWIVFMAIAGAWWVAYLLYRGSSRPLK